MSGCSPEEQGLTRSGLTEHRIGSQKSEVRSPKSERQAMTSEPNKRVNSANELDVYKLAYKLAMTIFEISKCFPPEERFARTTQVRRSSRSVCLNLREAWAKRRYEAHFISKLTDCDGENSETDSSVDFARDCQYISADEHHLLTAKCADIGRMLGQMMKKSRSFLFAESTDRHPTSDL
jgi:four helix bundle protein